MRLFAVLAAIAVSAASAHAATLKFEHVMNIGSKGMGEGQFSYVEDFAFSKEGHLLATDASHAWVQAFDKTTGKFIARFGGKGDDNQHLEKPEGIAVDDDGLILIADYTTGFIKAYNSDYRWLYTFSDYGSEPGQNMKSEFMDIRNGKLYMPDVGNHRVNVFDISGKFIFLFGGKGTMAGRFDTPEAAKFSSEGKLYVSDLKNDRIQVFDDAGKFLFTFGHSGTGAGELKAPAGLAFDRDDNVYVTEIGNDRVQVFDKTGRHITMWGKPGSGDGEFANLHGIIIDKPTGTIYVADTGNNRVQVFRPVPPATTGQGR